jgi:hypothetical protein
MTLPLLPAPTYEDGTLAPRRTGPGPDDRLSVVIDRPDGTQVRWADDEPDVANVPADLTFGATAPGGFKTLTCNLMRDLRGVGREGLFDRVRVLGPGGAVRWEGRLQQMPVSTEGGGRVTPQAVGMQAALEDRADAREIYVDRELGRWAGRPQGRQTAVRSAWNPFEASQIWGAVDSVGIGPALDVRIDSYQWSSAAGRPNIGIAYAAGGIALGGVEGRWVNPQSLDSTWGFLVEYFDAIDGNNPSGAVTVGSAAAPHGTLVSGTAPAGTRRAEFTIYYPNAPAGGPGSKYGASIAEVAVYGRHGLPGVRGRSFVGAGQGPLGFLASDGIADALRRWAPGLRFTTGPSGTITPTDYPVPHMVFADPTTPAAMVDRWNAFHGWDWFVWEDSTFYFRPRGGGRTWRIATADGLDLSLEGETTDRVYTGVVVTYGDYAGVQRSVGPPGTGADQTDALLVTTDPDNAAVVHGLTRIGVLQLSQPSDPVSAAAIGGLWLRLQAEATRRGQATVTGWATDDTGALRPVSEIRAGDTLIVTDRPDDPPRRIIENSYVHGGRAHTLTLDSTAATLEALLERIGAALTGAL